MSRDELCIPGSRVIRRSRRFRNVRSWFDQHGFFAVSFPVRDSDMLMFRFFNKCDPVEEVLVLPF